MEEIRRVFEEQTGIRALKVSRVGIGVYMIEAEDGNTYILK